MLVLFVLKKIPIVSNDEDRPWFELTKFWIAIFKKYPVEGIVVPVQHSTRMHHHSWTQDCKCGPTYHTQSVSIMPFIKIVLSVDLPHMDLPEQFASKKIFSCVGIKFTFILSFQHVIRKVLSSFPTLWHVLQKIANPVSFLLVFFTVLILALPLLHCKKGLWGVDYPGVVPDKHRSIVHQTARTT